MLVGVFRVGIVGLVDVGSTFGPPHMRGYVEGGRRPALDMWMMIA